MNISSSSSSSSFSHLSSPPPTTVPTITATTSSSSTAQLPSSMLNSTTTTTTAQIVVVDNSSIEQLLLLHQNATTTTATTITTMMPAAAADVTERDDEKACHELRALFTGINQYFRDEDLLKQSEHSSTFLGNVIFAAYLLVITFGCVGNFLTIMAVVRNKQMRTVRNFFILNLACSDFFVCTVTAPTTLYTVLYVFWPFSRTMCKIAGSLQGFSIFLSTFSITAIALDRYVLVIFPTKRKRQQRLSLMLFALIWIASILLAAPLFLAADFSPIFHDRQCHIELNLCNEQNERWNEMLISKEAYTIGVIILQYLLPLVAIAFAYVRIARRMGPKKKLRCGSSSGMMSSGARRRSSPPEMVAVAAAGAPPDLQCATPVPREIQSNNPRNGINPFFSAKNSCGTGGGITTTAQTAEALLNQRRKSIAERHRRTNTLLVTLVLLFASAWLPLNTFHTFNTFSSSASFSVPIFAFCHLFAMCSSIFNPCCYAFFNNNFRHEFIGMYRWVCNTLCHNAKLVGCLRWRRKSSSTAATKNDKTAINNGDVEKQQRQQQRQTGNLCRQTKTTGTELLLAGTADRDDGGNATAAAAAKCRRQSVDGAVDNMANGGTAAVMLLPAAAKRDRRTATIKMDF